MNSTFSDEHDEPPALPKHLRRRIEQIASWTGFGLSFLLILFIVLRGPV